MRYRRRLGMALVLALVLVVLLAFFGAIWYTLLRSEVRGNDAMTKHLVATLTGESVAAQVTALLNRWAWRDRFYAKLGQPLSPGSERYSFVFDETSTVFVGTGRAPLGPVGRSSWQAVEPPGFTGIVTDLEAPRSYRILIKVRFLDVEVYMTWDRVWKQGLMGSLNASDGAVETRTADVATSDIDQVLDATRATARTNMGGGAQEQNAIRDLDQLEADVRSGRNPAEVLFK